MKILLVEAQLRSFGRVKDGSVNYTFRSLGEINAEDFALTDAYYQRNGHLAFKTDEISVADLPENNTIKKGQVSPSKYLQKCLFAKHMKTGGAREDFQAYYEKAIYGFAQAVNDSYEE